MENTGSITEEGRKGKAGSDFKSLQIISVSNILSYLYTTPLRLFHETDMPIDSLQRDVSTLTETTKRDISSLQFGHFSYFFHLFI